MTEIDWKDEARRVIKAELARSGVTYKELAVLLAKTGVAETEKSIANKINRGAFSFSFFLQSMKALGIDTVRLER